MIFFPNFYTKKSICFDLDGYQAKQMKTKFFFLEKVIKKAPIDYIVLINDTVHRTLLKNVYKNREKNSTIRLSNLIHCG